MKKNDFIAYLRNADFTTLFLEMGYDNPSNTAPIYLDFDVDEQKVSFDFIEIAQKSSFKIFKCEVSDVPSTSMCKKIDHKLRKYAENYIAIFVVPITEHHLWVVPVRSMEKRNLVTIEYDEAKKAEFLAQKMDSLSFDVNQEVTITDVTSAIQKEFAVNAEKITKDFYAGFRKQHEAFAKFISGIDVDGDRQWYVSVMLNRLMFCYFIQKKGFLNFDVHYLRNKLEWCKEHKGENQYFTFYKGFLKVLFHGGLNAPSKRRQAQFEKTYGKIPYLNGGMFDEHQIERDYKDIDIKDEAFENLFEFFDRWNWHLDTRISASGKDINPDVLGYIFEQYINDRAQMGAYYTKEDITDYIGKNCILPYLLNCMQKACPECFEKGGFVWKFLAESGDSFIYDSVKKGVDLPLPDYVQKGVDTNAPDLLARRSRWNDKSDETRGLPTEIWRETVERRERCKKIRKLIAGGHISKVNDFITYNLDIRKFVEELIAKAEDVKFVAEFYKALLSVTILDPTCGSGAFLFAGMNILEPLYEACIERMTWFNSRDSKLFKKELDEIRNKYRSNIQYFIYKSIILRNLYGVDIMHEATEIAKLRLFLKMVAVVEVDRRAENLGLDPLPDIDFNIRCGNTLVGFANESELERSFEGDLFEAQKRAEIEAEMAEVANTYDEFRKIQLTSSDDLAAFKDAKKTLKDKLAKLNKTLDKKLHATNGMGKKLDEWKKDAQPFHWLSEFYHIIHGNGGFNVIIGNPPYVVYTKKNATSKISVADMYSLNGFDTESCNNLYAFVLERSNRILNVSGYMGMIIPISSVSSPQFNPLMNKLKANMDFWLSSYSNRPGKLFDVEQRLTIILSEKTGIPQTHYFTSAYKHWYTEERIHLFSTLSYYSCSFDKFDIGYSKISSSVENHIKELLLKSSDKKIAQYLSKTGKYNTFYHNAPTYFIRAMAFQPNKGMQASSHYKTICCDSEETMKSIACILNSSLYYWYYKMYSNCRDFSEREWKDFPCANNIKDIVTLSKSLAKSYEINKLVKNRFYGSSQVFYEEYYPSKSKDVIDEIDKALAKHYGFSDEELDFIINYDIKYRMGNELTTEEE